VVGTGFGAGPSLDPPPHTQQASSAPRLCPHSSQFPDPSYQVQSSPYESAQLGASEHPPFGDDGGGGEEDGGAGVGPVEGVGTLPQKLGLGLPWLLQIVDLIQTNCFEILE